MPNLLEDEQVASAQVASAVKTWSGPLFPQQAQVQAVVTAAGITGQEVSSVTRLICRPARVVRLFCLGFFFVWVRRPTKYTQPVRALRPGRARPLALVAVLVGSCVVLIC
jgi:hypothetical protein